MLLEVCESREAAEARLHHYAQTLKNLGRALEHGVYVRAMDPRHPKATWGVWLTTRESTE